MDERLFTDIVVEDVPEREVRFASSNTVYVEALLEDRWVGRYWCADGRLSQAPKRFTDPAFEMQVMDEPTPPSVAGRWLSSGWQWVSASELPKTDRGARHFVVELSNKSFPVEVKLHTLLDGTPVLTRRLDVTNTSSKPVALTAVYPWSGGLWSGEASAVLGHSLRWEVGWEGWFGWTPLQPGTNVFKNDKGLVWDDPYFVLRNEANGEYFFGQLAWPVNYMMEFRKHNGLYFKIGPTAVNALRVIAPGETITTPAVHLGHLKGDFDAAVQAMHDHIRRSLLPERKPEGSYLVQYLFPEDQPLTVYRGDEYNETNVKKCMDVAAAVGIELFIVDGPTWAEGTTPSSSNAGFYGNWVPRRRWFPRGFGPLVEYAHEKGLLFGLYAEPEGGRGDWSQTTAFKEHPEWFVPRRPMFGEPNFLNLARAGAADYMESELTAIIDRHNLDLYRHDQNGAEGGEGSATLRDGFTENDYCRHYEAFYGICERIHRKHPDLILQQASGGGTRLELATLGRFHEHYTSDRAAFPYLYQMASGLSVYLPPEILVTPNGMTTALPDLDTQLRGVYALGNTPMIFNAMLPKSPEELAAEVRDRFLHYANIYKTLIRPLLPSCKVYHHAPANETGGVESGGWFAMEFAAPNREKAWATIIRLSNSDSDTYLFKPKGLEEDTNYSVTFDNTGKTALFHGTDLMQDGLPIGLDTAGTSELLLFEAW